MIIYIMLFGVCAMPYRPSKVGAFLPPFFLVMIVYLLKTPWFTKFIIAYRIRLISTPILLCRHTKPQSLTQPNLKVPA